MLSKWNRSSFINFLIVVFVDIRFAFDLENGGVVGDENSFSGESESPPLQRVCLFCL